MTGDLYRQLVDPRWQNVYQTPSQRNIALIDAVHPILDPAAHDAALEEGFNALMADPHGTLYQEPDGRRLSVTDKIRTN